mmetsp:Transcript_10705/g.19639  ORF Transcript_10705/g.19639 Transcript_10705/m.19639 type:complete len:219 (-) Transcript_10705:110-766(-)
MIEVFRLCGIADSDDARSTIFAVQGTLRHMALFEFAVFTFPSIRAEARLRRSIRIRRITLSTIDTKDLIVFVCASVTDVSLLCFAELADVFYAVFFRARTVTEKLFVAIFIFESRHTRSPMITSVARLVVATLIDDIAVQARQTNRALTVHIVFVVRPQFHDRMVGKIGFSNGARGKRRTIQSTIVRGVDCRPAENPHQHHQRRDDGGTAKQQQRRHC